jgi:hypothetical protein
MHLIARDKIPRFVTNARQATPPFRSGGLPFAAAAAAKNPAAVVQNQPSNRAFRDLQNRPPETLKKGKKSPFIQ